MRQNPLADTMIIIKNAERVGKKTCVVPRSNLINNVLKTMEKAGYISKVKLNPGSISVSLNGKINDSRAVTPRYSCSYKNLEKFEKRYLPTKNIGIIVVSTSKGIINNNEARDQKVGGKLLAYVY